jgi:DNA-directed RNA polymerase I, II, and III subunit RPABC2
MASAASATEEIRHSRPFLTKYEFNQIIGLRTTHLSKGAPILLELTEDYKIKSNMDLREIALKELLEGKLPYIVKRRMPNGKYEQWKLAELDLTAVRHLLREA